MQKLAATAAAVLMAVTAAFVPMAANAQSVSVTFGQQDRYIRDQCSRNSHFRGCDDWRRNHGKWGRNDYQNWYNYNRPNLGSVAAGLFAFGIGSAIVNGINRSNDNRMSDRAWQAHVDACYARYKSYNERTDMFLSYNNGYQRCRL